MLPNDPLTRELLCAALGKSAPQSVIFSEVMPSTNDEAKRVFADGLNTPALFAAAEQNAKWRYNGYQRLAKMEY